MRRILICLLFQFLPYSASAARDGFHAYAALGINYSPMSFRVGYQDWELGMLNRSIGFDKIFDFGGNYYSSFGLVYTGQLGFFTGIGTKFDLWIIPVRCELSGYFDTKAHSFASALIGVTYGF